MSVVRPGIPLLTAVMLAMGGCDAPDRPPARKADEDATPTAGEASAASLEEQVMAVRQGTARRIRTTHPVRATEWDSLRGLAGLTELVVEEGSADDSLAEILATLPDLERLVLRRASLTDGGFRALAGCPRLSDLNVPRSDCTPEGVRALARIGTLRSLRLGGERLVEPGACEAIASLPALRSLHLIDVPIGDGGLAVLGTLPKLVNLYLDGAGVSDEAWRGYFEAHPDVHVHIDQSHHDRDPRAHAH